MKGCVVLVQAILYAGAHRFTTTIRLYALVFISLPRRTMCQNESPVRKPGGGLSQREFGSTELRL